MLIDYSPHHSNFYGQLLKLIFSIIGIIIAAVVLILWDLIGLLFTPILEVFGIATHIKAVADEDKIPDRISESTNMINLATEVTTAKDSGFLKDYSEEDPVKVSQLQDLCGRLSSVEANLKKVDQLDESTKCHKVLKLFASDFAKMDTDGDGVISKKEYVASGGSESDFDLFDVDGSGSLDAHELDDRIAAKQDGKDPESSLSISVPATGAGVGLPDIDSQTWAVDVASAGYGSDCGFGTGASSGGISSSGWQFKPDKKTLEKLDKAVQALQEGGEELSKTADKQLADQKEDEEKWLKKTDEDKWLIVVEKGWAQEAVRQLNFTYYKKFGKPIEMVITSLMQLQVLFICLLSHAHSCSLSHLAHCSHAVHSQPQLTAGPVPP